MSSNIIYTDYLIVGTGVAGLSIALDIDSSKSVTLVTKTKLTECNTKYAQGGIAAVVSPKDSPQSHYEDTINTGYGLCNNDAVKLLAENGLDAIKTLIEQGVNFTTSETSEAWNKLDLGREGGHQKHRIVHSFDKTGRAIEDALAENAKRRDNIALLERHTVVELITNHYLDNPQVEDQCYGAYIFDRDSSEVKIFIAKYTILATGGTGQIYLHTTNPSVATGDGIATAWRAGADIANMEFIQFHPTSLYHPDADSFLISEALRGHGAILKNSDGVEFMNDQHPMKSLAPRDVVARAIDKEIKESGEPCVFLDIRHNPAEDTKKHFPLIYENCLKYGIDITKDLIPVVPASHYSCGGIKVNLNGETTIKNLFACGEVSCTGVHGANRLASNSLLEAVVFAKEIVKFTQTNENPIELKDLKVKEWDYSNTEFAKEWVLISHNVEEIQKTMWDLVGIVRTDKRLNRALKRVLLLVDEIEQFYKETTICTPIIELRNMATTAEIIVRSALQRKESRGLNYNLDYPEAKKEFEKETILNNKVKRND